MRMTRVLLVVASLWSSCFLVAQSHSDPPLLIKAVKIIDVDAGIVRAAEDVLVSNGRIAEIAKRITGPAGATEIEGRGKFLIPGLWDMHVHLAGLSADPAWSRELLPLLVANGATGVRDMGGGLEALQQWKKR
jgi:imidazolonepropionase-like amidohydrolase